MRSARRSKLVARDSTSLYPEAALKLPDVGYMRAAVAGRRAVGQSDGHPGARGQRPQGSDRRAEEGQRSLHRGAGDLRPAGILEKIKRRRQGARRRREGGRACGRGRCGPRRRREADGGHHGERKRVLFILSMQGGKILASGSGTAADGIIELAGGVNAVEGFPGYKQLTDEAAIIAKPDIILMMDRGGGHARRRRRPVRASGDRRRRRPGRPSGLSAWTAAICSASGRARQAPSANSRPRSMATRSRADSMALDCSGRHDRRASGRRRRGDRSARARLAIVVLAVAAGRDRAVQPGLRRIRRIGVRRGPRLAVSGVSAGDALSDARPHHHPRYPACRASSWAS